jgi:hypothetical protein
MNEETLPLSWKRAVLAIFPGLLATMGFINTDFSVRMLFGLVVLFIFLGTVYWSNHKQLPGYSLMALGMLASIGLVIASGVIGGLVSVIFGRFSNYILLLVLLIISAILLRLSAKGQNIPPVVWRLFLLIIVCQLFVRIKYFVLLGVSWSVVSQWLNISLYASMMGLLLPVILGMSLSKRYGLQTMLFVVGMIYVSFEILIDVNFKVSDQLGGTVRYVIYEAIIPLLFTVLAPLWYLLAKHRYYRIVGFLSLIGFAIFFNLLVVGISYEGNLSLVIWISFIPYTVSVILTIVLAQYLSNIQPKTSNLSKRSTWLQLDDKF